MKTIGLTGNPVSQASVSLQLQALINGRDLPLRVRIGVVTRADAYVVHEEGGEVWLCGPDAPLRELIGLVDRTVPVVSFDELKPSISALVEQFLSKANLTGEPHHG